MPRPRSSITSPASRIMAKYVAHVIEAVECSGFGGWVTRAYLFGAETLCDDRANEKGLRNSEIRPARGVHASPKQWRHGLGVAAVFASIPLDLAQRWCGRAQLAIVAI